MDELGDIPHFRGVFSIDTLPKQINNLECGVINYDKRGMPGTHWVAYCNLPDSPYVEFFDSFGIPPGKEIIKYLKTSKKKIAYENLAVQNIDELNCGFHCISYIERRMNGFTS